MLFLNHYFLINSRTNLLSNQKVRLFMGCYVFRALESLLLLFLSGLAFLGDQSGPLCLLHQQHLSQCKYLCHCLGPKWVEHLTSLEVNLNLAPLSAL